MLLAAFPLTAFAESAPTLEIWQGDGDAHYKLTVDADGNVTPSDVPAGCSVTYADSTFTVNGTFNKDTTVKASQGISLVLDGGSGAVATGELDVTAKNLKITSASEDDTVNNTLYINCDGDVVVENTMESGGAAVVGDLQITKAVNVTVSSKNSEATLRQMATITCSGDVTIQNELESDGSALVDDLKINSAANVTVTSKGTDPTVDGDVNIACSGDVKIENQKSTDFSLTGSAVKGVLTVKDAKTITVLCQSEEPTIEGDAELSCSMDIVIKNTDTGGSSAITGTLTVNKAGSVSVYSKSGDGTISGDASISNCTGDVKIENYYSEGGSAVTGDLTVDGAKNVTVTSCYDTTVVGTATITCSGTVELECKNVDDTSNPVAGSLTFNEAAGKTYRYYANSTKTDTCPDASQYSHIRILPVYSVTVTGGTAYEKDAHSTVLQGAAEGETVCLVWEDAANADAASFPGWTSSDVTIQNASDPSGAYFTMPDHDVSIQLVDPSSPEVPDSSASGNGAGGALIGVAAGGAAIWGGYEIATRVILHKLLPAGAAIPTNRGELATLLWTAAGKPETVAQPAFADVDNAELACAAQWCVETGLMDANGENFKPNGWVPKYKTIEICKKAFVNQ